MIKKDEFTPCRDDTAPLLFTSAAEVRQRMEMIGDFIKEIEERLSVHDSIVGAASSGLSGLSEINEAICYARDALRRLSGINEVMEMIGGEVSRLKWELSRKRARAFA